jgi:beta-lactamase superfamily II metal-dependent hydrolase
MVDVHHHDDHDDYEHVIDYYKQNIGEPSIFRFIVTHPQKDHIKGIKRLFEDHGIKILNFWDLEHDFEPDKTGEHWEDYKEDWEKYCELRQMKDEEGLCVRRYWDHQSGIQYWDEDRIEILSPSKELHRYVHYTEDGKKRGKEEIGQLINNMSYVLLLRINDLKALLAADAEEKCWEYILKKHKDKIKNIDILKAAHEEAVKIMKPKHIVFSCTSDTDDEHGAEDEYKKIVSDAKFYKTHRYGTVVLNCDFDGNIT